MALSVGDIITVIESDRSTVSRLLVGPIDKPADRLRIIEDLRDAEEVAIGTLVFLTRPASRQAEGYHLDVAIRRLKVASGLVIQSDCVRASSTGLSLACRMEIPIIRLETPIDLGDIVARTARLLELESADLLDRAALLIAVVDRAVARNPQLHDVLEDVGGNSFGLTVGLRDNDLVGVPAVVTEPNGQWIQRRPTSPQENLVAELVSWRIAAAITRETIEADRANQLSLLSAAAILEQLLASTDEEETRQLVRRARGIGLPVDGWHEALRLEFDNLLALSNEDQVAAFGQNQTLSQLAMQEVARQGGRWSMAIRPAGPILMRTRSHPRSPSDVRRLVDQAMRVIDALHQRLPDLRIYCGIGSSHEGVSGLSATDAEAGAAIQSARLRGASDMPTLFDAPGIRRLLIEWYSSMTVRSSVNELLAPLGEFDNPTKRLEYLETLRVYLDVNRSVTKAAQILFVHRNTVVYRVKRIIELLGVDLDDPHQALAVHLACHAETTAYPSSGQGTLHDHRHPTSA